MTRNGGQAGSRVRSWSNLAATGQLRGVQASCPSLHGMSAVPLSAGITPSGAPGEGEDRTEGGDRQTCRLRLGLVLPGLDAPTSSQGLTRLGLALGWGQGLGGGSGHGLPERTKLLQENPLGPQRKWELLRADRLCVSKELKRPSRGVPLPAGEAHPSSPTPGPPKSAHGAAPGAIGVSPPTSWSSLWVSVSSSARPGVGVPTLRGSAAPVRGSARCWEPGPDSGTCLRAAGWASAPGLPLSETGSPRPTGPSAPPARRRAGSRGGAGLGRPPGLTQKFPLNSERVMAGTAAGAEGSGAATAPGEA